MRPPGDAACLGVCEIGAENLEQNPETEKECRRDLEEEGDDDNGDECQYLRSRVENKIGAHNARYGTACPHCRDLRVPVEGQMNNCRCPSAQEVKEEVADVPQSVFDVVSEYVEEPHIAHKMPEPSMQKHE